ncbi:MAG: ABC transporter substrate-binding protein [Paracoccus sp. (in: a-proteobacteria)]|nr:ABC transporter substrate-binding protein [Paracoccus sp. (in: a-proteobacteria)]
MIRNLAIAAGLSAAMGTAAFAETNMPFALDWRFEGPSAPYFAAIDNGHFGDAGLSVEITAGQGSLDAIPKVATGAFPVGFADMSSLVKFLDQNPGAPVTAVMMFYDKPAFAVIGRRSLGVSGVEDIEGITLGAPPPDGAWAQFPAFASANNIDMDTITVEPLGFPTREPMLAEGRVDAVVGFSFTSFLGTLRLGVPEDDLAVILMADHGLELYGNAIIANTDFAEANPEQLTAFLRAVVQGVQDTENDPEAAIAALAQRNPAMDVELETRRLEIAMRENILTDWVRENGIGGIDEERFARSIDQIAETYEFQNEPQIDAYFTDAYLPPAEERMIQ